MQMVIHNFKKVMRKAMFVIISMIIQVIRANFGRFSIAICNPHGATDWSVNCIAKQTTNILRNR